MADDATKEDETSSSSSSSSLLIPRILSGSIGSMAVALAVTPLEVVKIRQQMASASASSNIRPTSFRGVRVGCLQCGSTVILHNGLMECVLPTSTRTPPAATMGSGRMGGTLSTLASIFEREGIAGLYAGLRPTLVMSVPNTVLYFTAYDELSTRMRDWDNRNNCHRRRQRQQQHPQYQPTAATTAAIPLIAGSTARLVASLVTAPLELVRTRQAGWNNTIQQNQRRRGMVEELLYLSK